MNRMPLAVFIIAVVFAATAVRAYADDAEAIARHRHVQDIEALMVSSGDDALRRFANEHLSPEYRATFTDAKLLDHLREIRAALAANGGLLINRDEDGVMHMKFMLPAGSRMLTFTMQPGTPYMITAFDLESGTSAPEPGMEIKPITWETLAARMDEEAKNGFSGSVYVVRDGKVVLSKGYGLADRDLEVHNNPNTIFAIGSTPIDFTRAAVLKLEEKGKLKTSDRISKYFPDAPADKQDITIDELMSGESGLANFHHLPGIDANPDLTWIDRETAVKRIFERPLLFKPGEGHAHSHSAWVLLAALVEKVSGQTYGDFVQVELFKPAGMTNTYLHEGLRKINDRNIAIGYEAETTGKDNSPKYWGRTSWLVMGSGGMASTVEDMAKFINGVHDGTLLAAKQTRKYGGEGGLWIGGDDRGFFCMHAERGKDMVVVMSNAHRGPGDLPSSVGHALGEMVLGKELKR